MLVPRHPQPVARRRAVAEMIAAVRQAAPIVPGHVLQLATPAPAPPAPAPDPTAVSREDDATPV